MVVVVVAGAVVVDLCFETADVLLLLLVVVLLLLVLVLVLLLLVLLVLVLFVVVLGTEDEGFVGIFLLLRPGQA
jgi:hypothetical protein